MAMTRPDFDPHAPQFMHALCQMALDAGALIMRHYHDGVTEEKKADKSPVTQADRDAEIFWKKRWPSWPRIFK